jgi:hypothetical protein
MHFILAQLAVKNGSKDKGVQEYTATLKRNAKFDMHFTARLYRAMAGSETNREKLKKELNKMLRIPKMRNSKTKSTMPWAIWNLAQVTKMWPWSKIHKIGILFRKQRPSKGSKLRTYGRYRIYR